MITNIAENIFIKKPLSLKELFNSLTQNKKAKENNLIKLSYKFARYIAICACLIDSSSFIYKMNGNFEWNSIFILFLSGSVTYFLSGGVAYTCAKIFLNIFPLKFLKNLDEIDRELCQQFILSLKEKKNKEETLTYLSYLKENTENNKDIRNFTLEFIKLINNKNHDHAINMIFEYIDIFTKIIKNVEEKYNDKHAFDIFLNEDIENDIGTFTLKEDIEKNHYKVGSTNINIDYRKMV